MVTAYLAFLKDAAAKYEVAIHAFVLLRQITGEELIPWSEGAGSRRSTGRLTINDTDPIDFE
jgi:hypothetical protein